MSTRIRHLSAGALLLSGVVAIAAARPFTAATDDVARIAVFDSVELSWTHDSEIIERTGYRLLEYGQVAERTLALPPIPRDQRDARRITATLVVEPRLIEHRGGYRPGDPWTRLGTVSAVLPDPDGDDENDVIEIELMRFTTGFGGPGTFTANLTPFAPLLADETTLRVYISTFMEQGWDVSLSLSFSAEGVGYRRPVFAAPVFNEASLNAEEPTARGRVHIPDGLNRPRLYIFSTGHATDGSSGDEFITRTHILRINGQVIARWRPWAEDGGPLRPLNPMSGRVRIDGRELWSSDFDRSGWHPGISIEPLIIPVPELMAGEHEIEVEIIGIRPADPADEDNHHGYWRTSAIVVADEPWPRR